jgi:hypothetical protein
MTALTMGSNILAGIGKLFCRSGSSNDFKSVGGRDAADCGVVEKLGMSEYAQRFADNGIN